MIRLLALLPRLCVGPLAFCVMAWVTIYGLDMIEHPGLKQEIEFGMFGGVVGAGGAYLVFLCLRLSVVSFREWRTGSAGV